MDKIDVVPNGWGTPLEVFEHVYKHECHVSQLIDKLVDVLCLCVRSGFVVAYRLSWRIFP